MQQETAQQSHIGHRQDNQDRVEIIQGSGASLLIVVDGMGGHTGGALAAQAAVKTIGTAFKDYDHPILDPHGFLISAIASAHDAVVNLGGDQALDARPRATCALCLVQDGGAFWAHVGDSRIYLLRRGRVEERSRDHSHVELLLQEGMITEEEIKDHPMRNFVECCLGGEKPLPDMSVAAQKRLVEGDVLLVCTDGLWSGWEDEKLASAFTGSEPLAAKLEQVVQNAVESSAPYSDNTTAAALRFVPAS